MDGGRVGHMGNQWRGEGEAIRSSATSVHTRSTWRHIPEDGILHNHRREKPKLYKFKIVATNDSQKEFKDEKRMGVYKLVSFPSSPTKNLLE
jgi:hypothetical protein